METVITTALLLEESLNTSNFNQKLWDILRGKFSKTTKCRGNIRLGRVFRKSQTFLECYCSRVFVIDTVTISLLRLGFTFLSLWQKITWYIVLRLCLFYYHSNNSREGRRWDLKIWTFGLQPDEKSWHVLLLTCINKINKQRQWIERIFFII